MKSRYQSISIFVLLSLTTLACNRDDNPVTPGSPVQLMPLQVGNQWSFRITFFDTLGNVVTTRHDTMRVLRDTTLNNENWFVTTSGIYSNRSGGLWSWRMNPVLAFKYPGTTLDTVRAYGTTVSIVSTNELATVPYGSLSCYHYKATWDSSNGFHTNHFLSPGIGFVRLEVGSTFGAGGWYIYSVQELTGFVLR
jgi:hypothetical protein